MSIKSDKWIRHMAETTGMIEPFEPGQIRAAANGQKIISYGTSSYGYDIRCAPEFKVFTNIHSTVVDPKNFDEKSFVDFHDDVCIIPPNSFALARTSACATCYISAPIAAASSHVTPFALPSTPAKAARKCCSLKATKTTSGTAAGSTKSTYARRPHAASSSLMSRRFEPECEQDLHGAFSGVNGHLLCLTKAARVINVLPEAVMFVRLYFAGVLQHHPGARCPLPRSTRLRTSG
jgi:hypothetical protein